MNSEWECTVGMPGRASVLASQYYGGQNVAQAREESSPGRARPPRFFLALAALAAFLIGCEKAASPMVNAVTTNNSSTASQTNRQVYAGRGIVRKFVSPT